MSVDLVIIVSDNNRSLEPRHYLKECWIIVNLTQGSTCQWRNNGLDSVSNHQPHGCLLNRLFRRRSKKTLKLRVTGLCANSLLTGEFPTQMASNTENVSIWWCHHEITIGQRWVQIIYSDVIMSVMSSQIIGASIVNLCSGADQRKHLSSASLAFVVTGKFPSQWSVMQKIFPFDDVIMICYWTGNEYIFFLNNNCLINIDDTNMCHSSSMS